MTTWRERIVAARARGHFSEEDKGLAMNWCSCAVDEQREQHPLVVRIKPEPHHALDCACNSCRCPADRTLARWGDGNHFAFAVQRNDFGRAEQCLAKIEDRVLQLKRGQ